jgi:hypothetical protein
MTKNEQQIFDLIAIAAVFGALLLASVLTVLAI